MAKKQAQTEEPLTKRAHGESDEDYAERCERDRLVAERWQPKRRGHSRYVDVDGNPIAPKKPGE